MRGHKGRPSAGHKGTILWKQDGKRANSQDIRGRFSEQTGRDIGETLGRSFCICPLVHIRLTIWDGSFGKEQRLFTRLQAKINCAKKMFADLSAEDVVYHDVDSDQSLMNIIEGL